LKPFLNVLLCVVVLSSLSLQAGPEAFQPGALIKGYGMIAPVAGAPPIPEGTVFKVAFDLKQAASEGGVNRQIDSAARFLNMHHAAGVPVQNMQIALVVHGSAHRDLLAAEAYGSLNPNAELIALLISNGVAVQLCGQTAAYYGVAAEDLLPGIEIPLSAMTAHALLQQRGFTLNPF
jgi:intracellular sulfur oxidation DsrE/DsrF family protein